MTTLAKLLVIKYAFAIAQDDLSDAEAIAQSEAIAHIYIVPEGGLGLCSEGIYSLATRSRVSLLMGTCRNMKSAIAQSEAIAHIYIVPEGGLGLCSEGIYSLATRSRVSLLMGTCRKMKWAIAHSETIAQTKSPKGDLVCVAREFIPSLLATTRGKRVDHLIYCPRIHLTTESKIQLFDHFQFRN